VEEKKVAKMVDVLLAGGKMLPVHCAKCGGPLFEREGKVECAVCGEKAKPEAKAEPLRRVEEVLHAKLNSLAEQLAKETDYTKTLELLNNIKSTLEALEKLKVR